MKTSTERDRYVVQDHGDETAFQFEHLCVSAGGREEQAGEPAEQQLDQEARQTPGRHAGSITGGKESQAGQTEGGTCHC